MHFSIDTFISPFTRDLRSGRSLMVKSAFLGHASAQLPHKKHFSSSISSLKSQNGYSSAPLMLLPSFWRSMAPKMHTEAHNPHRTHFSLLKDTLFILIKPLAIGRRGAISIASTGHVSEHNPQPVHRSGL